MSNLCSLIFEHQEPRVRIPSQLQNLFLPSLIPDSFPFFKKKNYFDRLSHDSLGCLAWSSGQSSCLSFPSVEPKIRFILSF